jgi:2-polyprenyl-3-methyl-5-hydroxy-6-metoxy-1,4-benzoquinol methylase
MKSTNMNSPEQIQENQYRFPYHYLTGVKDDVFGLHEYLPWGLVHFSYIDYVAQKVSALEQTSVLDAGCGDGRMIFELRKHSTRPTYTGIDISERAIGFARAFNPNATFKVHDILQTPVQGSYDLCVSIEVIEHIPPEQVDRYVEHIAGSLQAQGTLVLTTPTTNVRTHPKHYQHFTLNKLKEHLNRYFEVEEVHYLNIENKLANRLTRLLANKYFIINNPYVRKHVFEYYKKHCLHADKTTGSRIFIHAKKK